MVKWLLLGANGQLGQALQTQLKAPGNPYAGSFFDELLCFPGPSLGGIDLQDSLALKQLIEYHRPQVLINAAAYTQVDLAQHQAALAEAINQHAVRLICDSLKTVGGRLLHFSSDYVFNSPSPEPIPEEAITQPINVYGHTKRQAELAIIDSAMGALIVRTSWLYSGVGHNFLLTMQRLLTERAQLMVVDDQWGVPSRADFVAQHSLALLTRRAEGIYHVVPEGRASWYEFACTIAKSLHSQVLTPSLASLQAVSSTTYRATQAQVLAPRPSYSVLSNRKLKTFLQTELPHWSTLVQQQVLDLFRH